MNRDEVRREEQRLKRAILRGDPLAWETLHRRCFDSHLAWVRSRCSQRPDVADEVVQESWMVALRRIRSFDPRRGTFLSWLRGIAANELSELNRREAKRRTLPLDAPLEVPVTLDDDEKIGLVLATLTPEHRELLRAKYVERRSIAEIAETEARTPKGVESMLSRARAAFRTAWARM